MHSLLYPSQYKFVNLQFNGQQGGPVQPLGNPVVAVLNCVNGRSNFMQTFWRLLRKNHLDIAQSIYAIITDHSNLVIVRSY